VDGVSFENGAPADLIIGQPSEYANGKNNPSTEAGLSSPTGLAVNAQGDLFVADSGNNRVVKFKRPFDQQTDVILISQVIGQPDKINTSAPAQTQVTESRLDLTSGSTPYLVGIAFDAAGNLWVADADNSRVLRFPESAICSSCTDDGPNANLLLGQQTYTDYGDLGRSTSNRTVRNQMRFPSGIAFDDGGRLYVADALNRVLVYAPDPQIITRQPADRIMGIGQGGAVISATTLGVISGSTWYPPEGVFTDGNTVFVVDTGAHRVLRYPPYSQWPAEQAQYSPSAESVLGQPAIEMNDVTILELVNRGRGTSDDDGLNNPVAGAAGNGLVYVVDNGNNRVSAYPDLSTGDLTAVVIERILGQLDPAFNSVNLVEGKEYFFGGAADVAFDYTSDPPRMYVSDRYNNRVLGYADAYKVRPGDAADLVIGQSDLFRTVVNWPPQFGSPPNDAGLSQPVGLAVDESGNLWVADSGNGRVLRFPSPFETERDAQGLLHADLVLGQFDFVSKYTTTTSQTMGAPYGITFTNEGWLLASDSSWNRVLLFEPPFVSGEPAVKVFGQQNMSTNGGGSGDSQLNSPRHISIDGDDRLYVADYSNKRIQIFPELITGLAVPSGARSLLK